jgi:hypothetical protein
MVEAEFVDARMGPCVLAFDGRALELFREDLTPGWRLHCRLVTVHSIGEPNRKGIHTVQLVRRRSGGLSYSLEVDGANLAVLRPVLEAAIAAG